MQTRHLLMTLLSTSVSAVVLANSPALASSPQQGFQPATEWSVNRIDPANGSAAYCTLARRFTGNTVITFARNAGGEGTIAIDFQQPLFSTGQTYRIGLQAGGGMKREFMTRPATPNALVLRTGQDPEFFRALSGSTELGVIMDQRRYAFAIPDFASGTGQLQGCLGETATAPAITASAGTAPSYTESSELSAMRAELDALRNENAGIVASLKEETATAKPQQQSAESNQLMQRLSALEAEKTSLVERLQAGEQQEMQDVSALKTALQEQKSMKAMLESERAQRQQLEQALTTQTAEAEKRGEMKARIEQLETSNAELKSLRDAVETERSKRIAAENALKEQASATLEEQERVRARLSELESQNKTLQLSAAQLETTKSQMTQELVRREAAENALKDMQISISQREADMASLQEKVEIERNKMEAAQSAKQAELSRQHADEMARLNAQINDIKAAQAKEVAEREALMGKVSAETARREAAEAAVRDMQTSISRREAEMAALQEKVDAERKKMESASNARDAELSARHADELARLNAEMEKTRAVQAAEQAKEAQAREELMGKVATEQARREAAEATVRNMQLSMSEIQAERDTAAKTVSDMQASISEREAAMAKLQEQMDAEREQMKAASVANQAEITAKHEAEIARLSQEMVQAVAAQKNEIQAREDLMAKVEAEQARREAAEKTVAELQGQIEEVKTAQSEDVQVKIATEEARREAAEKAMAEYQNKVMAEREEMAKAQTEKESEEIARLEKELALIKSAQAADMETAAAESTRRHAAEKELENAKAQLADAQKSGSPEMQAQMQQLEAQLADMEKRNTALIEELKVAQATSQEVQQSAVQAQGAGNDEADARIAALSAQAIADKKEMQAMLEAEQQRRQKIEAMLSKGSDDDARMKIMGDRMNELQARNKELQQRLEDEKAASVNAINPAAGDSEEAENLRKQLAALKADNEALAEKLANVAKTPQPAAVINMAPVQGDGELASNLAETQSSLASVMAERDEYRNLLQRERLREDTGGKKTEVNEGANARIKALEEERVDLIRQLEFERARLAEVAAGREPAPAIGSAAPVNTSDLEKKLAAVEAEKATLKKQLEVTQNDVIEARQLAKYGAAQNADVTELLAENKKLQMELTAATKGKGGDNRAMETEITALRAQNKILNDEINKRLAAAPDRATIDNVQAKADFTVNEAKIEARREVAADLNKVNTRLIEADAENIRLARELAAARNAPKAQPVVASIPSDQGMSTTPPAPQMMMRAQPATPNVMYTPASVAPDATQPAPGPDGRDISSYLQRSGISMVSGFEKINRVSNVNFAAFRWDTGVVFGTAEQQRINDGNAFKSAVEAYIEKTRNRCSGTFDESLADGSSSDGKVATADVACIMPDGTGAGAAMVFYYKDGMFNAVAHEGNLETFDQAMTTRDKLAGFIKGQL